MFTSRLLHAGSVKPPFNLLFCFSVRLQVLEPVHLPHAPPPPPPRPPQVGPVCLSVSPGGRSGV